MPQLISKLQHNTYEKGEFSDEQPRNLNETIELIKNFPWDLERPLTDIQLTGPSVTIIDNELNYLKLGLYFGGKFCVYYLDKHNHLYEYHAPNLEAAGKLVNDFFEQKTDLQLFEKHFFNIGNQPHFITSQFIYRIKSWRVLLISAFAFLYVTMFAGFAIGARHSNNFIIFPGIFIMVMGVFMFYVFFIVFKNRNQYLQISRGNSKFSFGQDKNHIQQYDKSDIKEIVFSQDSRSNRPNMIQNAEIIFKNNESIGLSNILISQYELLSKFPEKLGIPVIYERKGIFQSRYRAR